MDRETAAYIQNMEDNTPVDMSAPDPVDYVGSDLRKALRDSVAMIERGDMPDRYGASTETINEVEEAAEKENGNLVGDKGPPTIARRDEALRTMFSALGVNASMVRQAILGLSPEDKPAFEKTLRQLHFSCGQIMQAINAMHGRYMEPPFLHADGRLLGAVTLQEMPPTH